MMIFEKQTFIVFCQVYLFLAKRGRILIIDQSRVLERTPEKERERERERERYIGRERERYSGRMIQKGWKERGKEYVYTSGKIET